MFISGYLRSGGLRTTPKDRKVDPDLPTPPGPSEIGLGKGERKKEREKGVRCTHLASVYYRLDDDLKYRSWIS